MSKRSPYSRYSRVDNVQSKYCYLNSDIYINKLNIKERKALTSLEADLSAHRLMQLMIKPIRGKFGIVHLRRIHEYIFQDLYDFAGKFREEDITKGSTIFCKSQFIQHNLEILLDELKAENHLANLDKNAFIKRLAYYMAELNILHPFREGNGRTIREFIRQLALKNGYDLDWSQIEGDLLLQAMIQSAHMDFSLLERCLEQLLIKE